jgi:hypothetical protein
MTEMYGQNTAEQRRSAGAGTAGRKVSNIRVGTHPDQRFDRVVFDLSGGGQPGWIVAYTDDPRRDGSGEKMNVPGSAYIDVVILGIDWTNPQVPEYDGDPVDKHWPALRGVRWDGSFEGQTHAVIGLTERLPFRVGNLDNPERVFVDIAYA